LGEFFFIAAIAALWQVVFPNRLQVHPFVGCAFAGLAGVLSLVLRAHREGPFLSDAPDPSGAQPPLRAEKPAIWSCDPSQIKPWTAQQKEQLVKACTELFGWDAQQEQEKTSGPGAPTCATSPRS